jgi:hypothetical protein
MKHVKMLGLAAVAATALMAFAGAASASAAEFHSSAASASLVGNQSTSHKFTVTGGSVTCTTAEFKGTGAASGHSATQKMTPTYSGCKAFGFVNATIDMTGCEYNFHAAASGVGTTVDLEGCSGGSAEIKSSFLGSNCKVEVFNKTGINGITFENQTPRSFLLEKTNSTNIKYKVTEDTGACPLNGGEEASTGKYEGNSEVKANGGAAEIWVE